MIAEKRKLFFSFLFRQLFPGARRLVPKPRTQSIAIKKKKKRDRDTFPFLKQKNVKNRLTVMPTAFELIYLFSGSQFLEPDGWFPNHVPNPL